MNKHLGNIPTIHKNIMHKTKSPHVQHLLHKHHNMEYYTKLCLTPISQKFGLRIALISYMVTKDLCQSKHQVKMPMQIQWLNVQGSLWDVCFSCNINTVQTLVNVTGTTSQYLQLPQNSNQLRETKNSYNSYIFW